MTDTDTPVAPAPAVQPMPEALLTPLGLLTPSPTNPRKTFTSASIEEMALAIEPHGVMQPVLARPNPLHTPGDGRPPYEMVAGERRWRGCGWLEARGRHYPNAGHIPMLLRELTDGQVLALQLLENIQREDLHPLEEAEHYHLMTTHPREAITVEELAVKIGRSPAYVYGRLSLRRLVQPARDAFMAGKLDFSKALRVSAMPADQQPSIVEHITTWGGEPMGARAAARYIHDNFTLVLRLAPFNAHDAELLPEAGPCTTCQKRTDVNPDLFETVNEGDRCMDATCFNKKREAHRDWLVANARAEGYLVRTGTDASDVLANIGTSWHDLKAAVPPSLGDGAAQQLTVEQVVDKAGVEAEAISALPHPKRDGLLLAVPTTTLQAALRKVGMALAAKPSAGQAQRPLPGAERDGGKAPAGKPKAPPPAPTPAVHAGTALLEDLLAAPVLPQSVRTVNAVATNMFVERAKRRAECAQVVHLACTELRDRGYGLDLLLPPEVANMLLVVLALHSDYEGWRLRDVARLAGVPEAGLEGDMPEVDAEVAWAMKLGATDATCMVYALLALQEPEQDASEPVVARWPSTIARLLGVAWAPLAQRAAGAVDAALRADLLARASPARGDGGAAKTGKSGGKSAGKAAPKGAPKAGAAAKGSAGGKALNQKDKAAAPPQRKGGAVKYRNTETGETWTGRGLKPKWLTVALDRGATLDQFVVPEAAK